jgi:hypothetical protein
LRVVTTVPATSILLLLLTIWTPILTLSLVSTVRVSSSSSTSSETLRTPESLSLTCDLLTLGRYGCTYTSTTLGSSGLESFIGSCRLLTSGSLLTNTEEVVCVLVLVRLNGWLGITESTSNTGGSEGSLVIVASRWVLGCTVWRLSLSWLDLGDWCARGRWRGLVVEGSGGNGVVALETGLRSLAI